MTTVQQALHIFRKDVREFRIEIAAILAMTALLVLLSIQSWESLQERGGPREGPGAVLSVLLPLAWIFLIARAVQAEALPGDRHFWLTRPYSRNGLALSKLLLVASFTHPHDPYEIPPGYWDRYDGAPIDPPEHAAPPDLRDGRPDQPASLAALSHRPQFEATRRRA